MLDSQDLLFSFLNRVFSFSVYILLIKKKERSDWTHYHVKRGKKNTVTGLKNHKQVSHFEPRAQHRGMMGEFISIYSKTAYI